jgi:hypothetical protein
MTVGEEAAPFPARPRLWWVPYSYFLRVQIFTAVILTFGPPLALFSPLFRGLFDLDYGTDWRTVSSVALVSLAAFAGGWTLLATTWAAAFNAPDRFGTSRIRFITYPITWPEREFFAIFALPTIVTSIGYTWWASGTAVWMMMLGVLVGAAGAVVVLYSARWASDRLQEAVGREYSEHRGGVAGKTVGAAIGTLNRDHVRDGYFDSRTGEIAPGHTLAITVFAFSMMLYVVIGVGKWMRLGYDTTISTLACVLLLVIMMCWLGSGLTFLLDRYRVSLMAVLVAAALFIGLLPLPGSDHTYRTFRQAQDLSPWAHQVLRAGTRTPILIAATGGGIQAAAWTARVLTGIDDSLPDTLRDEYTHSIRLLSTVSGGGVGAMYFAERYRAAGFDRTNLRQVVEKAQASTLDDVAWGAAYPDAIATFFPPIRSLLGDRGQALETAWTRSLEVARLLSDWRTEVWSDLRPANVFNATLVDTGERLLMGTTRLGWREQRGLRNFEDLYKDREIQVVTAARLAASFTYVSPATRPGDSGEDFHVVDGGYYDDYGMATLTQWLDEGLEGLGDVAEIPRVLVIQIRSDPGDRLSKPDRWHGPFYQLWAPAEALLNVRATGQISHNDDEFERLQQLWRDRKVDIANVIFRFCGEHPPLSWHLTRREKDAIESEWQAHTASSRPELRAVEAFLRREPLPVVENGKPYDVPVTPCPAK